MIGRGRSLVGDVEAREGRMQASGVQRVSGRGRDDSGYGKW